MPDSTEFKWFVPSEHGDQSPDALITNRTMNRLDLALMGTVVICMIWNVLGVREVRSIDGGRPNLAAADDFFLRTSTIVLWSVVAIAATWLITRYLLTRETRFVLVWEGTILVIAALMPVLSMEMAGLSLMSPDGELRLTAYDCEGAPPESGTSPNLADCGGYPIEDGVFQLVGETPHEASDPEGRAPDETAMNTATWRSLPAGSYVMYLLVDIPDADCAIDRPGIVAIDADLRIDCLESGATVVRLEHPHETRNLRLAIYPEGAD